MAVTINASTSTGLVQSADTSGEIELQSNGTTALKVNTNEGIQILNCLGVGNATPSTSGAGITFPATQSASTNANTLDDYEEGTWTPTAFGENSAGTTTYNLQQGSYTKIGRLVTVSARIDYSSLTGTGTLLLGGLPFASANDQMEYVGSIMTSALNWTAGTQIVLYMPGNTTNVSIFNIGDDAGWGNQQCVNETVGMRYTITYFTA